MPGMTMVSRADAALVSSFKPGDLVKFKADRMDGAHEKQNLGGHATTLTPTLSRVRERESRIAPSRARGKGAHALLPLPRAGEGGVRAVDQ